MVAADLNMVAVGGTVTSVPTPHPERPRYRLVADELRRRILAGAIAPGQLLPSETVLIEEFGVSRGTIREAVALLRAEGLVVTEHGRGTYARPVLPVRRLGSDRYRREVESLAEPRPPETSFTRDQGVDWSAYQLDKEFREVPASAPVADPANEPWPGGNIAQLHSLGITVTKIRERVRARMPLADETQALRIPSGVPVLAITRQTYDGDRVVEVAVDIVLPADRTELVYDIDL